MHSNITWRATTTQGIRTSKLALSASSATVLGLLLATPAAAQSANPQSSDTGLTARVVSDPPVAPTAAPDPTNADEIIVTAQKRTERLQDVPIAISVVSGEGLEKLNASNLVELQGVIPGAYFGGSNGGARSQLTIRGTSGVSLELGDEPVSIYVDDVYIARGGNFGSGDTLDVDSIQIVKGPQGTLQGRNATGGAVLVGSRQPTNILEGFGRIKFSDPTAVSIQGAISGPLSPSLSGRLAGAHSWARGFATNSFDGSHIGGHENSQVRGILLFEPASNLSFRVIGDYSNLYSQPAIAAWSKSPTNPSPNGPLILPGTAQPNTPLPKAERDRIRDDYVFALNSPYFSRTNTGGASLKSNYEGAGFDIVSITAYRETKIGSAQDSDGTANQPRQVYNAFVTKSDQFSQELRIQSNDRGPLSWILGGYFFSEDQSLDGDIFNLRFTSPINIDLGFLTRQKTTSYAGFADATYEIADQFSVIGGIRYTYDKKDFDLDFSRTLVDTGALIGLTQFRPDKESWDDVSYRAKVLFMPNDNLLIYAGHSRGFRAGGFNAFATDRPFDPETLDSTEIGAKGDLFDRQVSFSLAAYRNTYSGLQIRAGVPEGGALIANAAKSKINGGEFELTVRPTRSLTFAGNVAYTDAIFTDFSTARNALDRPVDATGNRLPRAPEWQFFLSAEYDTPVSARWNLQTNINYRWRSKLFFLPTDQQSFTWTDGPSGQLGTNITLINDTAGFKASFFGSNLTNDRGISTSNIVASLPSVGFIELRTLGLSLEKRF